ncbi:MAG: hypothetical protein ACSHW2_10195, partial [Parasphingopyxis sp.]
MPDASDIRTERSWQGKPRFYVRELLRVSARPDTFRYRALQNQLRSASRSYYSLLPTALILAPLLVLLYSETAALNRSIAGAALVAACSVFGILRFSSKNVGDRIERPRSLAVTICINAAVAAIGWSIMLDAFYAGGSEQMRIFVVTLQVGLICMGALMFITLPSAFACFSLPIALDFIISVVLRDITGQWFLLPLLLILLFV